MHLRYDRLRLKTFAIRAVLTFLLSAYVASFFLAADSRLVGANGLTYLLSCSLLAVRAMAVIPPVEIAAFVAFDQLSAATGACLGTLIDKPIGGLLCVLFLRGIRPAWPSTDLLHCVPVALLAVAVVALWQVNVAPKQMHKRQ